MRRGTMIRLVAVACAAGAVALLVALFVPWLPTSASREGERIDFVFWFTSAICILVFAVVAAILLIAVVRFRARPDDDEDGAPVHGHTGLEIAWTAIPAVLVTAISVVSAVALAQNDRLPRRHLTVDVTAQQFAWSFRYPQLGGATSPTLRVPLRRTVYLRMRGLDVIHSFWVPQFRQKKDALPGQTTTLVITPTRLGRFPVVCAELCGLGHSLMRTYAIVMRPARFDAWARRQLQSTAASADRDGADASLAARETGS